MDTTQYQPAAHVLDRLKEVDFVAVIGPTAVGKSTLIKEAIKHNSDIHLVLNNTSREPRPGEQDGVDYSFRSREDMEKRIARREYVQVAPSILDGLYATPPEGYSTSGVSVMAVLAQAMPTFRSLPFKRTRSVFITPPDWETWQQRLVAHGFTPERRIKRLDEARHSFNFALSDSATTLLINNDLVKATKDFEDFILDPTGSFLPGDQVKAREVVHLILEQLEKEIANTQGVVI